LTVRDETQSMTRPGLVEFLPPADTVLRNEFGLGRYWIRVRFDSGEYRFSPTLKRVLTNTTMASQTESVVNEVLGSSDGGEKLKFQTLRQPVLAGQRLEVREQAIPSEEDRKAIEGDEGQDAITVLSDKAGRILEVWVRWHEVPDFYGSEPRSRHYVLDHLTGEVTFGDGLRGFIPPLGFGNIRMAGYQTGGGLAGNKPKDTITQLRTTIPYVDKVTNMEAATAGANAELSSQLLDRAPRTIRHRGRAVTVEDYEDLALLSFAEVDRAKCVPMRNLADDPLDLASPVPGSVSLIIVPRSDLANPQPSLELVSRVHDWLSRACPTTALLTVVGPLYVGVNVIVEIALASLEAASDVERVARQKLAEFLHPLTGGMDKAGWEFGRLPHASDLYTLLGGLSGVDHINLLQIQEFADPPTVDLEKLKKTGRFLVYSGEHTINLVYTGP
jgi:predicted phage baseplate assembly protein